MRTAAGSRYLSWILRVREAGPRMDLTNSGMITPLDSLEIDTEWARGADPRVGGDPRLRAGLARRYGVGEDEVLLALGTSLALYLAAAATLRPGDTALLESPGYEPLGAVCRALGARVRYFPRRPAEAYRVNARAVLDRLDGQTRLVGISDLHNPTGAPPGPEVAGLARELSGRGVHLLVDEVYRDFLPGRVATARRWGGTTVAVSSLTKVYGLGGLRAGWILGPPALIRSAISRLTLLHVIDPEPIGPLIAAALKRGDDLRATALQRSVEGRSLVAGWAATRRDLRAFPGAGGVHGWIELDGRRGSRVARTLMNRSGIAVVPGICFGDDRGIRVGLGGDREKLARALEELGRAVEATPPDNR